MLVKVVNTPNLLYVTTSGQQMYSYHLLFRMLQSNHMCPEVA
jgi:hypothetical protein